METIEKEYQMWTYSRLAPITEADRQTIMQLGSDLPFLWKAETTTNAETDRLRRSGTGESILVVLRA